MPPTAGCGKTTDPALNPLPKRSPHTRRRVLVLAALGAVLACVGLEAEVPSPAAWGGDHVGQGVPEYITGEECLFCHREEASNTWGENPHSRTFRVAAGDSPPRLALDEDGSLDEFAGEVQFLLGSGERVRFLKQIGYGKVALLSTRWQSASLSAIEPRWDKESFATSCAGCHTTAVDPETLAYSSPSLDCYVCHGNVDMEHGEDPKKMLLSQVRGDSAQVVISICAQCHVRSGRSRSSGLPYPNNFVAGDNLFRDFEVDFSLEALAKLSLADRHVLENVRAVVLEGDDEVTCLSCHDVHASSSTRHEDVWQRNSCFTCHIVGRSKSELLPFTTESETCER